MESSCAMSAADTRQTPLISVILPTHNCESFLGEAVMSVLRQTYPHWELWVVDDGSTDGTPALMASFTARDERIHYIPLPKQPSSAGSAVRNVALTHARGDYVAYLDSDDVFYPDALETLLAALRDCPDKVVAKGFYNTIDERGRPLRNVGVDLLTLPSGETVLPPGFCYDWLTVLDVRFPCQLGTGLYRRSLLDELGPFREDLTHSDDFEYFVKIFQRYPQGVAVLPRYVLGYRIQPNALTKDPQKAQALVSCHLRVLDDIFAPEFGLPPQAQALRSLVTLYFFRRVARNQLNLNRPQLARALALQARRRPDVDKTAWLRAFWGVYSQTFFPSGFYQSLAGLNREVRLMAQGLRYASPLTRQTTVST
ncbi:MAG: glycosyltransferase family 2 protein [Vampirovibrionales bacterium]|nr:glycosyltransferase family 2 protein [Vampirovibrionales bacterium]